LSIWSLLVAAVVADLRQQVERPVVVAVAVIESLQINLCHLQLLTQ
jgi:hypothetical protein